MVPLKVHNILDYVIALALVSSPSLLGFSHIESAESVFLVLGVGLFLYSLITKYYFSIAKLLPVGLHMTFDVLAGITVIGAPFALGYRNLLSNGQFIYHLVMGLAAITLVALTRPRTESAKTARELQETTHRSYRPVGH
jgi:hypothetical protein